MRLWEVDHPHHCNQGNYYAPINDQPTTTYESWKDFHDNEGNSDKDMNLLFRFDWRKADPKGEKWGNKVDTLYLFWMGQRKGLYRWTEVHVTDEDEEAVKAWLQYRFDYLKKAVASTFIGKARKMYAKTVTIQGRSYVVFCCPTTPDSVVLERAARMAAQDKK